MKLTTNNADLTRAMSAIIGVISRKNTIPILGNVLIVADESGLTLTGTSLEIEAATRCAASVDEPGAVTVPAYKLFDIARALDSEAMLTLTQKGKRMTAVSGRSRFQMGVLPSDDFPIFARGAKEETVILPAGDLYRLLSQTCYASAQQDVRYYLNGILLEFAESSITAVATDGHRLSAVSVTHDSLPPDLPQAIIPRMAADLMRKMTEKASGQATLALGDQYAALSVGEASLITKKIDGRYPDWRRIVPPSGNESAVIDRAALKSGIECCVVLANEKFKGIKFSYAPGTLTLSARNAENDESKKEIDIEYSGIPVEVAYNAGYLVDALNSIADESIRINFKDLNTAITIAGIGEIGNTRVVMPMRV